MGLSSQTKGFGPRAVRRSRMGVSQMYLHEKDARAVVENWVVVGVKACKHQEKKDRTLERHVGRRTSTGGVETTDFHYRVHLERLFRNRLA